MADFTLPQVRRAEGLHPTGIEWTDYSANPLRAVDRDGKPGWACVKVSSGCANCYSETINLRFGTGLPFVAKSMPDVRVVLDEQRVAAMLAAKPRAPFRAPDGRPKVFIGDMTDVFGEWVPFDTLDRLFAIFALRPDIDWQVLTKRPERMAEYFNAPLPLSTRADHVAGMAPTRIGDKLFAWGDPTPRMSRWSKDVYDRRPWPGWPLPNVWLGTSVEDRPALARIVYLRKCPAAVRFISFEPLLEDLGDIGCHLRLLGHQSQAWAIVGGESGAKARPCDVGWIRSVVHQCADASVPCFVKQCGSRPLFDIQGGMHCKDWIDPWLESGVAYSIEGGCADAEIHFKLNDRKGGAPSEWPADLRVRQWPEMRR